MAPGIQTAHYISASRRCDLPRFGCEQFFAAWKSGSITYDGGYGRSYTVSLKPLDVLGYIFWSKDYSHFIKHADLPALLARNNAVFHYTINDCPELEPNLPPVDQRLEALAALCGLVGPERVLWRYDPICQYIDHDGRVRSNYPPFFRLIERMAGLGLKRCYFSFMTSYSKLRRRPARFLPFTDAEKQEIAAAMLSAGQTCGVQLYNCCNPEVVDRVPGILSAQCIDDRLLDATDRFGVHVPLVPKPTRTGCGCYESRDIGSYYPACPHGCFYCYANPKLT
jgi:hypothetical protein